MYIVVRFGDKEEGIFNPNCKCITLLNNIRERCVNDNDDEIELSDETGSVKNLRDFPYRYANELVTDREKLILLRVDRKDNGDSMYTPLLNDKDFVNDNFISQLASRANLGPGGRRNRTSSSRRTPTNRGQKGGDGKGGKPQPPAAGGAAGNKNTGGRNTAASRAKSRAK